MLLDAGIRPKLSNKGEASADFSIEQIAPGFINMLGLESPGLTSCLAIAEKVEGMVKRDVYGLGRGSGKVVSEYGSLGLFLLLSFCVACLRLVIDDWA